MRNVRGRPSIGISVSGPARQRRRLPIPLVRKAVRAALTEHGRRHARITIALVDDAHIARLNEKYLDHQGPTDVLTFPLGDPASECLLEGDVVVSVETAAREAAARGHALEAEVLLYVVHGVLHLLGLDDTTKRSVKAMREAEDRLMSRLGYPGIYAGRRGA